MTLQACASATPCPKGKDYAYCSAGQSAGGCSPWNPSGPFPSSTCTAQCVSPASGSTGDKTNYTFDTFSCQTGDCGGKKACVVSGTSPATLFEWTFTPDGTDIYDISTVDGYNIGITVAPAFGTFNKRPGQDCASLTCSMNTTQCPPELQMDVVPGVKSAGTTCLSICAAVSSPSQRARFPVLQAIYTATVPGSGGKLMRDLVCCSCGDNCGGSCGCTDAACAFGCSPYVSTYPPSYSSRMCRVENWPLATNGDTYIGTFQRQCPGAYAWQFDDANSLRYCSLGDYDITFCG